MQCHSVARRPRAFRAAPEIHTLRVLYQQRRQFTALCPPAPFGTGWPGRVSSALGPSDPLPGDDEGEQAAKRRRGRPRKAEQPASTGAHSSCDGPGPAVKRSRGRPPREAAAAPVLDAATSARPQPARTPSHDSDGGTGIRRRGRPPRAESRLGAAAGAGGPPESPSNDRPGDSERSDSRRRAGTSGGSSGGRGVTERGGDIAHQPAATGTLSGRRGRPRREGPQKQAEEPAQAEGVSTAVARRGRPPLQKASREAELQVMLRRELRLKPTELKPPPASWKRLRDGAAPETLRARVLALKNALGLEVVRRMVQRCPHLLHWHEATLLSKLDDLTLGLGLSRQELLGAVLAYPRLLQSAPDTVLARVALLQAELRLPLKVATAMVTAQPPLVCMSPSTLRLRADLLHEAASLLPQWRHELSEMAPGTLGRMLRCSEEVLNRLVYTYLRVSTNGKKFHEIRSMKTITTIPAAQWREKNPLFQEWLDKGARDRAKGDIVQWDGWWRGPQAHGQAQGQGRGQAGGGASMPLPPGGGGNMADWWGMPSGGLNWSRVAARGEGPHTHPELQPGTASSSGQNEDQGSGKRMGSPSWSGGFDGAPPGSLGARGSSGVSGLGFGDGGLRLTSSELWQRYWELGGGGDGKRWTPPDNDSGGLGVGAGGGDSDEDEGDGSDGSDEDEGMEPEDDGRSERRA